MFSMRARVVSLVVLALVAGCGGERVGSKARSGDGVAGGGKAAGALQISGPYTHENLAVYLIHGKDRMPGKVYTTLEEAMAQKKVIVHETGDVNELAIQNVSDDEVYVQSGDIVKGGRQDRTIANDFVLAPKSQKVPIAAFCVEAGRWQQRGGEGAELFALSSDALPSKGLKLAVKQQQEQGAVWQNVARSQQQLTMNSGTAVQSTTSPSSLQLTLENTDHRHSLTPSISGTSSS